VIPREANRVRWDGGPRPFYEVWYAIFVDRATGDGFWIRYTLLNPLDSALHAGATAWFAYTCRADPARSFAVTRHFGGGAFHVEPGGEELRFGDGDGASAAGSADACIWTSHGISGSIAAGGHQARWELRFDDDGGRGETHLLLPQSLRRVSERRSTLTIPRPQAALTGRISVDGRAVDLVRAPGHQAHHYGPERAVAWDWGHCAHFEEDRSAVVEVLAPLLAGGRLKPTFVHLHTAQHVYRCERTADLLRNRSSAGLGWWRFVGHDEGRRIEVEFASDPARVLPFTYHSTAYAPSRCWNTQTAECLVRVLESGRETLLLRSRGLGSAEMHRSDLRDLPYERWSAPAAR
jgi:hypothetical protein